MKTRQMNKGFIPQPKPSVRSFTLLELIIVIIIIGILATLGLTQYTYILEKARLAEAIVNIGHMRLLATEYYLKNGSLLGIQNADVGATNNPSSNYFYVYRIGAVASDSLHLTADRSYLTSKSPVPLGSGYYVYLHYNPSSNLATWHCYYLDETTCFGMGPE